MVYPSDVENILLKHSNVLEVQVFGIDVDEYFQDVCAWVRLKSKAEQTSPSELKEFCHENDLIDYQIPKYFKFVEQFPSSSVGKYLKTEMEKQFKKELDFKHY